jgi:hypothetical protein
VVTNPGSNYFAKLEDAKTKAPVVTLFIHGGNELQTDVPVGRFVLKYASGETWCGENALFGSGTVLKVTRRDLVFGPTQGHTISLDPEKDGNLPVGQSEEVISKIIRQSLPRTSL